MLGSESVPILRRLRLTRFVCGLIRFVLIGSRTFPQHQLKWQISTVGDDSAAGRAGYRICMNRLGGVLMLWVVAALPSGTSAQSFDCKKATTASEYAVCGDSQLEARDNELAATVEPFR
jgi:hypothetical protein